MPDEADVSEESPGNIEFCTLSVVFEDLAANISVNKVVFSRGKEGVKDELARNFQRWERTAIPPEEGSNN